MTTLARRKRLRRDSWQTRALIEKLVALVKRIGALALRACANASRDRKDLAP
jgi:hypothetical protein